MNIVDFEKKVTKKYGATKVDDFKKLKKYLVDKKWYSDVKFTPEVVTENEISNDDYLVSYVFDENKIANRQVNSDNSSGWTATIVILSSIDKKNITNYTVCQSNGLTTEEYLTFLEDINPLAPDFALIKKFFSKELKWEEYKSQIKPSELGIEQELTMGSIYGYFTLIKYKGDPEVSVEFKLSEETKNDTDVNFQLFLSYFVNREAMLRNGYFDFVYFMDGQIKKLKF